MMLSNPLRPAQFAAMTYRRDNTGNIYQTSRGVWRMRFNGSDFKNERGAACDDYDVAIARSLWPHMLVSMLRFACQCPRCRSEQPASLRHEGRLLEWFDRSLERSIAVRLDATPDSEFVLRHLESAIVNRPTIEIEALHDAFPAFGSSRRCAQ
jgi:hypothetical protein